MISEIYRVAELNQINIKTYPSLVNLKKPEEDLSDILKQSSEQLLVRWFNYHLKNATSKQDQIQSINNLSEDIKVLNIILLLINHKKDGTKYSLLLNQLSPLCDLTALTETNVLARIEILLKNAEKINCRKYISAQDILNVN